MYTVHFDEKALQNLEQLEEKTRKRIFKKILAATENPFHYFDRLTGREEFKLRVGDYRVIAEINEQSKILVILVIDHRKNIYKKM